MMQDKTLTILLWSALAVLGNSALTQAQTAAALVLEVSGTATPRLEPYGEILDSRPIRLAKKARLTFLHYDSCRMATVEGGTITFGPGAYTVTGGMIKQESEVVCPKRVNVVGTAAAIQLRGLPSRPAPPPLLTTSTRPTFVLVGQRARNFVTLRVSQEEAVVLEAPVSNRHVQWPLSTRALAAGTAYEVHLIPAAGDTAPVSVMLTITDTGDNANVQAITLLNVE
jgi:hypothetical protein